MKKDFIRFKTRNGDVLLRRAKILSMEQEKEGSDWYKIAYKFTSHYVHNYIVLLLNETCDLDFMKQIVPEIKESKNDDYVPAIKSSYWGGNINR